MTEPFCHLSCENTWSPWSGVRVMARPGSTVTSLMSPKGGVRWSDAGALRICDVTRQALPDRIEVRPAAAPGGGFVVIATDSVRQYLGRSSDG